MEFALSRDQRQFQDTLQRALERCAPLDRVRRFADDEEPVAKDVWSTLIEVGATSLLAPEEHGGLGLGLLDAALVAEALGRFAAPAPFLGSAVLGPLALKLVGEGSLTARWSSRLATGHALAAVGLSEAIAGARDGAGVTSKDGRLDGSALFVLDAPQAQLLIIADAAGSLHFLEDEEGQTRSDLETIDATRRFGEVRFAKAPAKTFVRPDAVDRLRDAAWVMLAADTLGAADAMLAQALAYAQIRQQFSRPIGSFQAVKHLCAEMAAELEPARALVWYAAYALDHDLPDASVAAAHAKAHLSEIGRFVARTATEVHGGIGITDQLGLHYWFKRIGMNRQLLGGPERVRHLAASLQGFC